MSEPKWGTPEWHREHAIFGTKFDKKPSETIEKIRSDISKVRGQLGDVGFGFPGYKDQLEQVEGSLTLALSYLYHIRESMKEHDNWPKSG